MYRYQINNVLPKYIIITYFKIISAINISYYLCFNSFVVQSIFEQLVFSW
jgi:hypothetical protein